MARRPRPAFDKYQRPTRLASNRHRVDNPVLPACGPFVPHYIDSSPAAWVHEADDGADGL